MKKKSSRARTVAKRQSIKHRQQKRSGTNNTNLSSIKTRRDTRKLLEKAEELIDQYDDCLGTIATFLDSGPDISEKNRNEMIELGDQIYKDAKEARTTFEQLSKEVDELEKDEDAPRHAVVCDSFNLCARINAFAETYGLRYATSIDVLQDIKKDL